MIVMNQLMTLLNHINIKENYNMKHKQSALKWWNNLSKREQEYYEFNMYGYGELFEDNTLNDRDIIHMYNKNRNH